MVLLFFRLLSFLRPVFSLKLNPEAKPQYKVGTLQSREWLRLKIRSFKFAYMTCQDACVVLCVQNFLQCTCSWTRLGSACPVLKEANLLPLFVVKENTGFIARLCNTRSMGRGKRLQRGREGEGCQHQLVDILLIGCWQGGISGVNLVNLLVPTGPRSTCLWSACS